VVQGDRRSALRLRDRRRREEVYPVAAPADEKHAAMLASRIQLLREHIIPAAQEDLDDT
jgi:hypothetical protein